jgi:hypothetical protein
MSTKRKTLKQKKIKDIRTSTISQTTDNGDTTQLYTFESNTPSKNMSSVKKTSTLLTYNLHEIRYSLMVSVALLLINTLIFILITKSIVPINILGL